MILVVFQKKLEATCWWCSTDGALRSFAQKTWAFGGTAGWKVVSLLPGDCMATVRCGSPFEMMGRALEVSLKRWGQSPLFVDLEETVDVAQRSKNDQCVSFSDHGIGAGNADEVLLDFTPFVIGAPNGDQPKVVAGGQVDVAQVAAHDARWGLNFCDFIIVGQFQEPAQVGIHEPLCNDAGEFCLWGERFLARQDCAKCALGDALTPLQ